jgi:hypothetical protein
MAFGTVGLTDERKWLYMDQEKDEQAQIAAGSLFKTDYKIEIRNILRLQI